MLIDSQKLDSHIYAVCSPCIFKAMKMAENKFRTKLGTSSYIQGECDVCHKITTVANVQNFMYPVFKVKTTALEELMGMK